MSKPILNISDVELQPRPAAFAATGSAAERFDARMGFIAPFIGAQKLGYNLTAVPPGKRNGRYIVVEEDESVLFDYVFVTQWTFLAKHPIEISDSYRSLERKSRLTFILVT